MQQALFSIRKNLKIIALIALSCVAVFLILGGFFYFGRKPAYYSYSIPDVPYRGLYEKTPFDYPYYTKSTANSLSTIFSYWHNFDQTLPNPTIEELEEKFLSFQKFPFSEIAQYFKEKGFIVELVRVQKLEDFKKFISSERKTPLIIAQPVGLGIRPVEDFVPLRIVKGISFSEKSVSVHDYFLGPDLAVPFDEFIKSWGASENNFNNLAMAHFIAVYPENYDRILKNSSTREYLILRTPEIETTARFVKDWLKLKTLVNEKKFKEAVDLGNSLLADSKINYAPRFLLSGINAQLARSYNGQSKFQEGLRAIDAALDYGQKMDFLDMGMNQFMPGPLEGKNILYYYLNIKAQSYQGLKQNEDAIKIYEQMLTVIPDDQYASNMINFLKKIN